MHFWVKGPTSLFKCFDWSVTTVPLSLGGTWVGETRTRNTHATPSPSNLFAFGAHSISQAGFRVRCADVPAGRLIGTCSPSRCSFLTTTRLPWLRAGLTLLRFWSGLSRFCRPLHQHLPIYTILYMHIDSTSPLLRVIFLSLSLHLDAILVQCPLKRWPCAAVTILRLDYEAHLKNCKYFTKIFIFMSYSQLSVYFCYNFHVWSEQRMWCII